MCAHGREGQTHIGFVPRHSLKNFVRRGSIFDDLVFLPSKAQGLELQPDADSRAPRAAVRAEKRADKNVKIRLLFSFGD